MPFKYFLWTLDYTKWSGLGLHNPPKTDPGSASEKSYIFFLNSGQCTNKILPWWAIIQGKKLDSEIIIIDKLSLIIDCATYFSLWYSTIQWPFSFTRVLLCCLIIQYWSCSTSPVSQTDGYFRSKFQNEMLRIRMWRCLISRAILTTRETQKKKYFIVFVNKSGKGYWNLEYTHYSHSFFASVGLAQSV